ncbi:MAG: acyl-CoA dehydrogenase family protein [Chloroflexi bacterium]|nr:acyl-CoA dehydrogenase family protein [Chloroflexota bacterium]
MEFRLSPAQEALRVEVRDWLRDNVTPDIEGFFYAEEEEPEKLRAFNKRMAAKGWIAPSWPAEYGGMALGSVEQLVFGEEMAYARAPSGGRGPAVGYAGPTIMMYGTPEQKRRHLPGITNWDAVWCQGFSEPGSGSDLASLQTTAVRDGDDWVLNGTKIWTSHGHYADWMYLLARTDPEVPKHKGISYFLLDLKSPGVSFQPLLNIAGRKGFGQFFFDGVRMPAESLLGEVNRGWYLATTTLDLERSNIANTGAPRRAIDDLCAFLRDTGTAAEVHRTRVADLAVSVRVASMLSYRVASILASGGVPNQEASLLKLFLSELDQRIANSGLHALGMAGALMPGSPHAKLQAQFALTYLTTVPRTIAGGTSEIQRNIIATRGLGLPR